MIWALSNHPSGSGIQQVGDPLSSSPVLVASRGLSFAFSIEELIGKSTTGHGVPAATL